MARSGQIGCLWEWWESEHVLPGRLHTLTDNTRYWVWCSKHQHRKCFFHTRNHHLTSPYLPVLKVKMCAQKEIESSNILSVTMNANDRLILDIPRNMRNGKGWMDIIWEHWILLQLYSSQTRQSIISVQQQTYHLLHHNVLCNTSNKRVASLLWHQEA